MNEPVFGIGEKVSKQESGVVLEVRFTGTNRDQYIPIAMNKCLQRAGLEATECES